MPLNSAQVITIQVETPPPDELLRGSLEPSPSRDFFHSGSESTSSQWLSPSTRSLARPRVKGKAPRRSVRSSPRSRSGKKSIDYPGMPRPLSELTKHMTDVPIKDMEAWVHRPLADRQMVAKDKGKIARPMNSFMLYRSAYADRAKKWFAQNNHQVVSTMAGQSWRLESSDVRKKYELLAKIEKINHEKAHPGYRFAPEKDKKKRDKSPDDDRSRISKCSDSPSLASSFLGHTRSMSSDHGSLCDSRSSTPFGFVDHGLPAAGYLNSTWHSNNPGRPAPGMMSPPEPAHYLHQTVHPSLMGSHVEDVRFRRVGMHDPHYTTSTALAGLPGAAHHELLQPQTTPGAGPDGQLDPQLLGFQGDASNGSYLYGNSQYSMWQDHASGNGYLPVNPTLSPTSVSSQLGGYQSLPSHISSGYQSGLPSLMDGREAWDPSHDGSIDTASEFDSWINSHQSGY